ncbi:MAG: flagellar hook-basal body protein [Planctomycetes bacterium]|nr:flagellar hook-basal body protein [Planctomycetota bacterium]
MSNGLYVSAAGAEVQSRRLQTLSNNLANVDTPGFKREIAILQSRHAEAIERGTVQPGSGRVEDVGGGVEFAETKTDFTRGVLRDTGIATDLALDDENAFFVVRRDDRELLTRAGNFAFSDDGALTTQEGYPVLGDDGPIRIDPTLPWRIENDGRVLQGNAETARLRIAVPASRGDLAHAGGNLFAPLAPVGSADGAARRVRPGFLEMSTVQATTEMMELIETSRAFETNIRMIQHHDQITGALVNRVLKAI